MPVIVVTGFLGAGKTTLIRSLLQTAEGRATAVVVNEFGEIGIDQALLRQGSDKTILLGNGCLCCRMVSDLQRTCADLMRDRARGTVPPFERIIVETSGLADPSPMLQTFIAERGLRDSFHLQGLVAVVDAATFEDTVTRASECVRQVLLADRIVVTKTDLIDAKEVSSLLARLRNMSPSAEMLEAVAGRIAPEFLLDFDHGPRRLACADGAAHAEGISTFSIVIDDPIEWEAFAQALSVLTALRGIDLLRVKGLIHVAGCPGPVILNLVQHLIHPPIELEAWPTEDRRSRIVFIARNMTEATARDVIVALQNATSA